MSLRRVDPIADVTRPRVTTGIHNSRLLVVIAAIGVVAFAAGALVGHMSTVRSGSAVRQQVLPLSELGAPKGYWNQVHPRNPSGADSSFLPLNTDGTSRYADVEFREGRVFSIIMRFDAGTLDQRGARQMAMAELPPDARLVFDEAKYLESDDVDDQCELLQYQSEALAFPRTDTAGVVSVVIWSPDPGGTVTAFQPASITAVNLAAAGSLDERPRNADRPSVQALGGRRLECEQKRPGQRPGALRADRAPADSPPTEADAGQGPEYGEARHRGERACRCFRSDCLAALGSKRFLEQQRWSPCGQAWPSRP